MFQVFRDTIMVTSIKSHTSICISHSNYKFDIYPQGKPWESKSNRFSRSSFFDMEEKQKWHFPYDQTLDSLSVSLQIYQHSETSPLKAILKLSHVSTPLLHLNYDPAKCELHICRSHIKFKPHQIRRKTNSDCQLPVTVITFMLQLEYRDILAQGFIISLSPGPKNCSQLEHKAACSHQGRPQR